MKVRNSSWLRSERFSSSVSMFLSILEPPSNYAAAENVLPVFLMH